MAKRSPWESEVGDSTHPPGSAPRYPDHALRAHIPLLGALGGAGNAAIQQLLRGEHQTLPAASTGSHLPSAPRIQRIKVTKAGTAVHSGQVGGPPPGQVGVPVGFVQVRTGEDIELTPGSTIPNVIALEYSGSLSADSRWLQFVWFELTAATPKGQASVAGNVPTSSGNKPFTTTPATPSWTVDSASASNPFYEAGAAAIRTGSSTTMFDAPGGSSVAPFATAVFSSGVGATAVTFTAHFDTYLIQKNQAAYHVSYSASTGFTPGAAAAGPVASAVGYSVPAAGPATAIPGNLHAILTAAYPAFSKVR
jgi:hypothetical protein